MSFALPPIRELPPWPAAAAEAWGRVGDRSRRLAQSAGEGRAHRNLRAEAERLIDAGAFGEIAARVSSRGFARALAAVWRDDATRAAASMSPQLVLRMFDALEHHPSRLVVATLAHALFRHFDILGDWDGALFEALAAVVHDGADALPPRAAAVRGVNLLETLRHRGDMLLRLDSPRAVAREIADEDISLRDWLVANGMLGVQDGRWGELVRQAVYLEQIARCDPEDADELDFLHDLLDETLLRSAGADGLHFGHAVLRGMTDRSVARPDDLWIDTIVEIGGDPRLAHTSAWHTWWQPLPEQNRAVARRWMSVEDLRLFLEAVENFGLQNDNEDLLRMFRARKIFMWGLYEQGLVLETRLIMGNEARRSVARQLEGRRPEISHLKSPTDLAIIYLDCGSFHLVEGSHSFKLWIYEGRPVQPLVDRSKRTFTLDELRREIPEVHARQSRFGYSGHVAVPHMGFWQRFALEFIVEELGVALDVQTLMDPDGYRLLRDRYGLPVPGSQRLR